MTDFLANVVRRSQRPDLSLRPRAASLFEPEAPFARPVTWPTAASAAGEAEEDRIVVRAEQPSTPRLQATRHGSPGPTPSLRGLEEGRVRLVPDSARAQPEQKPNPLAPSAASEPSIALPTGRDSAPQADTRLNEKVSAKEPSRPVEQPESNLALVRPASPPTVAPERTFTAGTSAQPAAIGLLLRREPAQPAPLVIAAMRRADPIGVRQSRTETSRAEPAIQVSIGRVEVRAITAERTSRSHERPSPVMSLEDYLAGHAGGGRR